MKWRTYAVDGCKLIQWRYGVASHGEASIVYCERVFLTEQALTAYLWPEDTKKVGAL